MAGNPTATVSNTEQPGAYGSVAKALGAAAPASNPAAGTYTNVPNPANPAQQEINNPIPQQAPPASVAAPPASQPAQQTATVDPRDATYYDQLAKLNLSYQNSGTAYTDTTANDLAAYNYTTGLLTQALPNQIKGTLNKANSQGILESGIAGQNVGIDQTNYANKMGAALTRRTQADNTALNRWNAAQQTYGIGTTADLNAAIDRAAKADLASGAVTPTTPVTPPTALAATGAGATSPRTLAATGKNAKAPVRAVAKGANSVGAGAAKKLAAKKGAKK